MRDSKKKLAIGAKLLTCSIPSTGFELRAARKAAGMTQRQLAVASGVGRHTVQYWEKKSELYVQAWGVVRMVDTLGFHKLRIREEAREAKERQRQWERDRQSRQDELYSHINEPIDHRRLSKINGASRTENEGNGTIQKAATRTLYAHTRTRTRIGVLESAELHPVEKVRESYVRWGTLELQLDSKFFCGFLLYVCDGKVFH